VTLQARVTVVSAKLVDRLAAVTVEVAFASINVPLGSQALSVSILTDKSTQGDTNFFKDNFKVVQATHVQNCFIVTLVLFVTSQTFCTLVALAKVSHDSIKTASHAAISSQFVKSSFVSLSRIVAAIT